MKNVGVYNYRQNHRDFDVFWHNVEFSLDEAGVDTYFFGNFEELDSRLNPDPENNYIHKAIKDEQQKQKERS